MITIKEKDINMFSFSIVNCLLYLILAFVLAILKPLL